MSQQTFSEAPHIEVKKGQYGYYIKLPQDYEISVLADLTRTWTSKKTNKAYVATKAGVFINLNKSKYPAKSKEPQ